ncbi:MAG: bifunctional DNA-formamidopyrimidine glycosylase/DNA-(apurinic or apyrimidinic site) lyase [Kiritimatiellia bacterium]|jgi:formamidopyrimidine-DNA glycosylase|nr:bifunctional DNA-formamidopyrimidine glycosylase/DNA-(apurinic or apyrimidinic site) lyase [Kiritimatiellia bacterium]MDD4443359.1 bifunctional DNA-formamidopyrimidine glycosylase/DNA-(apurinic or apyrimidinic site) lyase [Kiritimatiellia bacterium]MDX9793780.1 bifunctional DNA-formamidopyrimidine glycosylase/DNA-(apurinic or apyrimidinic site) lyase [Kiritimatiellia bacterium]NLC81540.1 bifunctional DNA-formamidopyrimidine glycosylase/DNA-(apurinic or apyrimidinic site) lyase [Lentisphaerota
MPELPEVETVVRDLRAHSLPGCVIRRVIVRWPRTVAAHAPDAFCRALAGRAVTAVARRAKYIVLSLDTGDRLLIHLRMTGKLRFAAAGERPGPHDHVTLCLADGRQLVFNDTRKFGRFRLVSPGHDPLAGLGPEPLEAAFTLACFRLRLAGKTRQIKPLLLEQSTVAGLGNIYVDEALWHARIHPERRANTLTAAESRRLHRAIRAVLQRAVDNAGTTLGDGAANFYSVAGHRGRNADALQVFRRDGQPCPRCGTVIARKVVGQRGTHLCPHCQTPPT